MKHDIKTERKLRQTQKLAIGIPLLFLVSGLLKSYVENFRFSPDLHWIFAYFGFGFLMISLLCAVLSFVNTVLIIQDLNVRLPNKILWVLLSGSVFLYTTIMLSIVMFRDVG